MPFFKWLADRRPSIKFTWLVSWPDASGDRCLECKKRRDKHPADHKFKEAV